MVGAQLQSCAGHTAALTVRMELLPGAACGDLAPAAGPSVGLDAMLPLPCPTGCDGDYPLELGSSILPQDSL